MLKERYGYSTPIFEEDLNEQEKESLSGLMSSGELFEYTDGVHYFPKRLLLGWSYPYPFLVASRKFITDGEEVYGYVSGLSLLNQSGMSTQMPNGYFMTSNKVSQNTEVKWKPLGRVWVTPSLVLITKENVNLLQFLDLAQGFVPERICPTERKCLIAFGKELGVDWENLSPYFYLFPKAEENLIKAGVKNEITQE